ncbi:PREDICTED: advillin-like [Priapulus caudatus]|uniref:Advillin-like n=1 Tax=Priapulus caudatus TaxID=37621 RepID=A0ABM1EJE9_PRICU|nr:PREDICTED: advillin-like [Priapulus caudatus]
MATGNFQVEEIMNFTQEDLNTSDVMMLDTYYEIGLWMGDEASEDEKKQSLELVGRYVDTDPSSRKADDTVIVTVKQGFEPPSFTGHFHPWNSDLWSEGKSFLELKEEFGKENLGIKFVEEELKVYNMSEHRYEDLVRNPPPLGVDATKKESYLSDNEFKEIMQMTKEEFYKKPEWKRIDMKKKAGLF